MRTISRRDLERLGEPFGDSCTRREGCRIIYGGGGGGGGNTTSTNTNVNYSPEEAARRTQVMDEAQRVYGATAGQMNAGNYPGARPAGVDWHTTAGQDLTRQGAGQVLGAIGTTQGITNETMADVNRAQGNVGMAYQGAGNSGAYMNQSNWLNQGQNQMMAQGMQYGLNGAMDVRNNPYLQQAMQAAIRPVQEQWQGAGGSLAQQRAAAQQAGQVGSSRAGIAEGITNRAALQKMGDITSQMGNQAYQSGQDTYSKTLAQIPAWMQSNTAQAAANQAQAKLWNEAAKTDIQGAGLSNDLMKNQSASLQQITNAAQAPGAMYSGIGAQNENVAREWEDYAANQRMWGLNAPWIPLQNYASLVYGGSAPSTQVQSSSSGQRNALGQVVGAGLTGASMYGMMNS